MTSSISDLRHFEATKQLMPSLICFSSQFLDKLSNLLSINSLQRICFHHMNMQNKSFSTSVFIFRRDLRLQDNMALLAACSSSSVVVPIFIFQPKHLDFQSPNYNPKSLSFMISCLQDLNKSLGKRKSRLVFYLGQNKKALKTALIDIQPQAVFQNQDVTPGSACRRKEASQLCSTSGKKYISQDQDYCLLAKQHYLTKNKKNSFYRTFTDYFKNVVTQKVELPKPNQFHNFFDQRLRFKGEYQQDIRKFATDCLDGCAQGGRSNAMPLFTNLNSQINYAANRNTPCNLTTKMAPYLKFGCVSIREFHNFASKILGPHHDLIRQLYWRDFFYHLLFYFPHVYTQNFHLKYQKVVWNNNQNLFEAWKTGNTGCPLVDAGMRQLNKQGWISNIMRLLTANFLVKNLFIDWKLGQKYFATTLIDYDVGINSGSWQFVAGTGKVQQPYYLIINCFSSEKFDKQCKYIKTWIPQLKQIDNQVIHQWQKLHEQYPHVGYAQPIVSHQKSSNYFFQRWQEVEGEEQEEQMFDLEDLGKHVLLEEYDMQYTEI